MKMKELLLFLSCVLCVSANFLHEDIHIVGCSESNGEVMFGLDGEELWYADFENKIGVSPQPSFVDPISFGDGAYETAVINLYICKTNMQVSQEGMKDYPLNHDAPSGVMIYTRNEVELRVTNTLICHVTGFYPGPVKVSWTKNGQKLTEGFSINVPYPNKDGTFKQIARLQFIPQQGDIYSCTVEHLALKEPLTKIYNVEAPEKPKPSVGPAVFCGLGVIIGLLSAAGGTFFILKANKCT
ncbi:mamu class II histocompatibility antigen, DR alpha chain-like [Oreochromis niloticus]|uniref:Mamu class II histocompatibility antigen, DR alpha chain-like n=1 Tax=Oreochromis niloticus TaxID=8128 RepID=I3JGI5_ORENI|nr:mamu class II histocompatibility antigen, DR alpha chain-like [Oreochromis niloticus]